MRKIATFFLLLVCAAAVTTANAQEVRPGFDLVNYGVRVEPDKRVMVVLAALEMAGTGDEKLVRTPLSESGAKFRERLLKDNEGLSAETRQKITQFVTQYKRSRPKATDADLIAPFISMAYTLTPAPELADPIITNDLPGSLLDVLDFAPLVRDFYRRSTIASKLDEYVKLYKEESDNNVRRSAREMVSDLLDYLHTRPRLTYAEQRVTQTAKAGSKKTTLKQIERKEIERRFFLVPEMLAARGAINFVNVRDDYYVVLPPETDLSFSDVRRAFLQFVIDPLVYDNVRELGPVRTYARTVLDEKRRTNAAVPGDEFLAITRSLVAAVDVRQTEMSRAKIATEIARDRIAKLGTDAEKRKLSDELEAYKQSLADEAALRLFEDYERGAVLSFYFAEQLKGVEQSGFDIGSSMREMLASFDPAKEANRVSATAEARKRALAARESRKGAVETTLITAENPVTTKLIEVQRLINGKELGKATSELKALLAQNPTEPRIFYNLGRIAGLEAGAIDDPEEQTKKLIEAKNAYVQVLKNATATTDIALLSLTYVSLARIYEHNNDKDYAIKLYDQAIKLDDVRGGGYSEAIAAKQRLLKP